ncbi:hypothetical protein CDAR_436601 [Caerostris darwini]|uniref:Uncharacterized protein n=1 Tax=Caerostris darwini TaxID=1538125 RepID=A0AAV4SCB8_9ARAC|nr:hypothetical protein CDAR_436601 [Caerostris darwini]
MSHETSYKSFLVRLFRKLENTFISRQKSSASVMKTSEVSQNGGFPTDECANTAATLGIDVFCFHPYPPSTPTPSLDPSRDLFSLAGVACDDDDDDGDAQLHLR